MDSKKAILANLSPTPDFARNNRDGNFVHVVPDMPDTAEEILLHFVTEAEKLTCKLHRAADEKAAVKEILALIDGEERILGWSFDKIGVPGLEAALNAAGIRVEQSPNPAARYGLTGADAALAATGSIVLSGGEGKPRSASLLPLIHIAVLRSEQILQDFESWIALQENFTATSNVFVISGPSKTADIAMELVMGMHGPQELHIILLET